MRENDKNLKNRLFCRKSEKPRKSRYFEKTAILAIFVALILVNPAYSVEFRRAETLEDAHAASCRINAGNSRGTGTFFLACGSTAYIVTCQHVVGSTVDVSTDFWGNSVKQNIKGRVLWRYLDNSMPVDVAIIGVDAETLKREVDPPYVPLAGSDARPTVNGFIVSSGAPDGRFTQAWKGKVVEYYQDATAIFSPPPVPGQSGSGIMEYIDGDLYITGILTWLIGEKGRDDSKGGAIPVSNIYRAAKKGKRAPTAIDSNTSPIPPNATECRDVAEDGSRYRARVELSRPVGALAGSAAPNLSNKNGEESDATKAVNEEIFRPTLIYYTRPDCPACQSIESEIDRFEIDGVDVKRIDVSKQEGYELAKLDGVEKIPCIVVDQGGRRSRVDAEELLSKDGAYLAVKRRIQKNAPTAQVPDAVAPVNPQTREPVRDDGAGIAEILDETENSWRNRRQDRQERREERRQEREEERERPAPTPLPRDDGEKESSKLGDRIADRIADALSRKVESESQRLGATLEAKIAGKLDGAVKQIEKTVVQTILEAINEKIKRAWELTKSAIIVIVGVAGLVFYFRRRKKANDPS